MLQKENGQHIFYAAFMRFSAFFTKFLRTKSYDIFPGK